MGLRIIVIAGLSLLCAPVLASIKPEVQVTAAKGPVQITFQLYKTTTKVHKSLWYKLELKNIGKTKMLLVDRTFKDPWAMYQNSRLRYGIYLEIIDPKGKPMNVRWGGDHPRYDWEPPRGETYLYTPEEKKEIMALQDEWKKRGMTEQQQSIALSSWISELCDKKNMAESTDQSKQKWLNPGASTTTLAWAYRDTDEYADHSTEEAQIGDYAQLWSYHFFHPGKYRVRAVFNYSQPESTQKLFKKHGHAPEPWWLEFKSPFIEFEVLP